MLTKLDTYIENIKNNVNFSFTKRGDGELACMRGDKGANCDSHPYTRELGDRLKEAFEFMEGKANIAEWVDQVNFNMFLHRTDNDLEKVREFWKTVKISKRKKIFVGPERLAGVINMLNIDEFIEIPLINTFENMPSMNCPENDSIYIFSCGMPAKVLIVDMLKGNKNITCIDAGSSFDPIFIGKTRTEQADKETLRRLYLYRPSEKELNEMFSIPQARHPERLFKLARISDTDEVIYDLGCSIFKTLDKAIGVDIENKEGVDLVSSVDDLPMINDNSVDVVLASHILEHMFDTYKTLKEWHRILKPGGRIIFILPDDERIDTLNPMLSGGCHLRTFTQKKLASIIEIFDGLEIEELTTVMEGWSFGGVIRKTN